MLGIKSRLGSSPTLTYGLVSWLDFDPSTSLLYVIMTILLSGIGYYLKVYLVPLLYYILTIAMALADEELLF